jgi:hypothetical protein
MPVAIGEIYSNVQLGLCLGGIIRIFEDQGSSLWSVGNDITIFGLQCGGFLARTAHGEHGLREAAGFHSGTGTLMLGPRFPLRSESTAAGLNQRWATFPVQLAPPEPPRAMWPEDLRELLTRAIRYAMDSGLQLRVETGGWDSPRVPFCAVQMAILPDGAGVFRFEASPVPGESRWWNENVSNVDEATVRMTRPLAEFTAEQAASVLEDSISHVDPWDLTFTYADPQLYFHEAVIGSEPTSPQPDRFAWPWMMAESQPPDLLTKRRSLEDAATDGDKGAMSALGVLLIEEWDPPDLLAARAYLERAAAAGDTRAMYGLGDLLIGRWDPPDPSTARIWYERAAIICGPDAMYWLGGQFAGRWDPPDLAAAQVWWERAALAGHTGALCDLGLVLARSDPPDLATARRCWETAAADGHAVAMVHLGNLCAQSNPPDLAAAQAWWANAADAGDSNAMYNLAISFASSDPRTAIAWIEKAAAAGHSEALAFLNERER